MFTIIGGDGKEYGPVTVEQIRTWIASGRANLDTQAKALGTEEWRRVGDFAEFASPDGAPPVLPGAVVTGDSTLAGQGARIGAAFINAIIYLISMTPGSMLMSTRLIRSGITPESLLRGDRPDMTTLGPGLMLVWGGLLAAFLLQSLLIAWRGQNLGKLMVGIRVVRVSDGGPAGFVRGALLRFLLPVALIFFLNIVPGFGFLFFFVDFCFIFGPQRRCLHDLMAGTKVVKT